MRLNKDTELGEMYDKKFLLQTKDDTSEGVITTTNILASYQVVAIIDMLDCSNIIDYELYMIEGIDELGKLKLEKLKYLGWQPMSLIQFADTKGNIVISDYGTDH